MLGIQTNPTPVLIADLNPFPGLRSFNTEEDYLFFGREEQTDELLHRLRSTRFLAVVGASGSGKSSLVRAGLLPSLYSGVMTKAGSSWRLAVLQPGSTPIANLARALHQPDAFGSETEDESDQAIFTNTEDRSSQIIFTETTLRRGPLGLVEVVQQARIPEDENLLIVVDQFEELFRFQQNASEGNYEEEAEAFVKLLLEATKQPNLSIYVVLTMRSDYFGDCAKFQGLPEAINESQYLIPRLTRTQIQRAIEGPIAVSKAKVTPTLVNRLLNDVSDNPDQLPILQHALMRTWDYWKNCQKSEEPIDLKHYREIGGMRRTLSIHADEIYHKFSDDRRSRKITEKLFKSLTEEDSKGRRIRRPIRLEEVCAIAEATEEEVISIVEQFRAPGRSFLMPPVGQVLTKESVLDISHESLMRIWEQLEGWVEEEEQSVKIYRRLAEASQEYNLGDHGLYDDPELSVAIHWRKDNQPNTAWANRYGYDYKQAMRFLEASNDEHLTKIAKQENIRQQEINRLSQQKNKLWLAFGIASVMAVIAGVGAFIAVDREKKAERAYVSSYESKRDSVKFRLGIAESNFFKSGKQLETLLAVIAAGKELQVTSLVGLEENIKNDYVKLLQELVDKIKEYQQLEGHEVYISDLNFSSDSKTLVSVDIDKKIKFWSVETGKIVSEIDFKVPPNSNIAGVSFDWIALAGGDGTIKLKSTKEGQQINDPPIVNCGGCFRVIFSPDGKTFSSALSRDGTIKLWNIETGQQIGENIKAGEGFTTAAFEPDGNLGTLDSEGTFKLWDLSNGKTIGKEPKKQFKNPSFTNSRISFRDNQTFAITENKTSEIRFISLENGKEIIDSKLVVESIPFFAMKFSPDGETLATSGFDGIIRLWKLNRKPDATRENENSNDILKQSCKWLGSYFTNHSEKKQYSRDKDVRFNRDNAARELCRDINKK